MWKFPLNMLLRTMFLRLVKEHATSFDRFKGSRGSSNHYFPTEFGFVRCSFAITGDFLSRERAVGVGLLYYNLNYSNTELQL
jgi:hypothetical protein